MRRPLITLLCLVAASLTGCASTPPPIDRPNIVIVFVDDMGYGDIAPYGATTLTPHLTRMAKEGSRFTDFYAVQPVCSASRAGLLTGCYPNRIGITGALGPNARHGIHADEVTLADLCKSRGYATAAYGKWHLGHHEQFLPRNHGFDDFYGIPYSNDMWPMHPENPKPWGDLPTIEGETIVGYNTDQNHFTTDFTNRAVEFIEAHQDQPFFVYVAHPMPHVPLHVSDNHRGTDPLGLYGDVMREIDWSVGRILTTLERLDLDDDTLVIFTSDNGPWLSYGNHSGVTGPLREGKGTTFEGGVRVPCLMRWPGQIPAGNTIATPLMTIDIFPTVARLIGGDLPSHGVDGRDAWSVIVGETTAAPQEAYFFYYRRNDLEAMRSGRWKLHFPHTYRSMIGREVGADGMPGKYDYGRTIGLELFDLATDIGESTNVADQHPEVVERLLQLADAARADLGDTLTDVEGTGRREPGRLPDSP